MKIEKSRFSSEATPQPNVNTGVINGNDFSAIVPVIAGRIGGRETALTPESTTIRQISDTPSILPLLVAGRVAGSTLPRSITSPCGAG